MKEVFRLVGKTMAAALIAAGVLLSGCGVPAETAAPSTAVTVAEAQTASRAPSVALLESMLARALDPNVPDADKLVLVQGATAADASLFDDLVALRADHPDLSWRIANVHLVRDGHAVATVSVLVNGTNQRGEAQLVFDGGRWKLDGAYACDLLRQFDRTAPSCEPGPPPASPGISPSGK